MVQIIEDNQEEKPRKKNWIPSIHGRFGLSFMFGTHEVFVGFNVSKVEVSELVKVRRRIVPGKGKVFNL